MCSACRSELLVGVLVMDAWEGCDADALAEWQSPPAPLQLEWLPQGESAQAKPTMLQLLAEFGIPECHSKDPVALEEMS